VKNNSWITLALKTAYALTALLIRVSSQCLSSWWASSLTDRKLFQPKTSSILGYKPVFNSNYLSVPFYAISGGNEWYIHVLMEPKWKLSTRKTALCKGQFHALWSSIRTSIWSSVTEMQREWERNAQNNLAAWDMGFKPKTFWVLSKDALLLSYWSSWPENR